MAQAVDPRALALMRQVKAVFDPDWILNPGKLLPPM
jgi:D-lactate dehydrogenase